VRARFDATARTRHTAAAPPRVHLADLAAILHPDRRVAITAAFTIRPLGPHSASFTLPPGCRLVQTLIDNASAPCTTTGLRSWKVSAPSELIPYRLTIVYDTFVPIAGAALRLTPPRLTGMEVQHVLWDLAYPATSSPDSLAVTAASATVANHLVDPSKQHEAALTRLQTSAQALEDLTSALGSDIPADVLAESYARWRVAFESDYRLFVRSGDHGDLPDEAVGQSQAALDAAARVRQRLIQAGVLDENEPPLNRRELVDSTADSSLYFIVDGPSSELLVVFPRRPAFASRRQAMALGLVLAAILMFAAAHSIATRDWLWSQGPFVVGIMGVAWWLLAPVGWLGLILVAAACWLALRPLWPRSTMREAL
jgi:hypothetical protein